MGYTDYPFGPNVEQIRAQATKVIKGRVPADIRKQLMVAVKAGELGRLKKDGLKPEIFFHPDHLHGAVARQKAEAMYSVNCVASVIASPAQVREGLEAAGVDVLEYTLAEHRSANQ